MQTRTNTRPGICRRSTALRAQSRIALSKAADQRAVVRRILSGGKGAGSLQQRRFSPLALPRLQGGVRRLQRKLRTSGPDISPYLVRKGILNFSNPPGSHLYSTAGVYYDPVMTRQILHAMLRSGRVFDLMGATLAETTQSLDDHLQARKGVVDLAATKKFGFATGLGVRMNTQTYWQPHYYWDRGRIKVRWWYKKDLSKMPKAAAEAYRLKAMADAYKHPANYKVACWAATKMTMHAGSGSMSLVKDTGVADDDWVPGDWGYIKNTQHRGKAGQEGMNIIYVGNNRFWGHTSAAVSYNTLTGWELHVAKWGKEQLMGWRHRTGVGVY